MTGAIPQTTSYVQNGFRVDTNQVQQILGAGVPQPTMCLYNVIPAAAVNNYVAVQQAVQPNVPLTLTAANSITFLGQYPVVELDCQRGLSVTVYTGNTTAATTITVTGYDDRNVAVTATGTLPTATVPGTYPLGVGANITTGTTGKCFSSISSVTCTANPGQQISIGTGLRIGLPYFLPRKSYISNIIWNTAILAISSTNIVSGFQFNPIAVSPYPLNYPATVTAQTTDARGFVDLSLNGVFAPNGQVLLSVYYYVYGADSYLQAQLTNMEPTAIGQTQIGGNTAPGVIAQDPAGNNIFSYNQFQMLAWDEVGAQFPGGF